MLLFRPSTDISSPPQTELILSSPKVDPPQCSQSPGSKPGAGLWTGLKAVSEWDQEPISCQVLAMKSPNFYIFSLPAALLLLPWPRVLLPFTGTMAMGSDLLSLPPLSLTPSLFPSFLFSSPSLPPPLPFFFYHSRQKVLEFLP